MSEVRISRDEFVALLGELRNASAGKGLPRRARARWVLMRSMALLFERGVAYREAEVTEILRGWLAAMATEPLADHVTLRRLLVDAGYLVRDAAGAWYERAEPSNAPFAFAPEVESVNVFGAIQEAQAERQRQRRAQFPDPGSEPGRRLVRAREIAGECVEGRTDICSACAQLADLYDRSHDRGHVFLNRLSGFGLLERPEWLRWILRAYPSKEAAAEALMREFLAESEEWIQSRRDGVE